MKKLFVTRCISYWTLTWVRVRSQSRAKVCRFFNGEYWDNSLLRVGEPSKEQKLFNSVIGYSSNKLWYGLKAFKHLEKNQSWEIEIIKIFAYLSISSGSIILPPKWVWCAFCGRQKLSGIQPLTLISIRPTNKFEWQQSWKNV